MKKSLLIIASAALLLAGCAKDQFANQMEGELTNVTFTANLENGVATKAFADSDGNGTEVNRCIMEIYFGEQFYKRLVEPVTTAEQGKKVATFADVPVVAGKEYTILFWADCGGGTDNKVDKYYTTTNLKTVTVAKTAFLDALKTGKNDKLDAFFGMKTYTFAQAQEQNRFDVPLKRPFAQLNVITTDVAEDKAVISAALLPDSVSVNYTAASKINVATGEVSGDVDYEYVAPVYGETAPWDSVKTRGELTLSMDYILASATEQSLVNVTFKTKIGDAVVMTHGLNNLPYQRNYRTNVKGDLLTVGGTWTATIDPIWGGAEDFPVYEATVDNIAALNTILASDKAQAADEVIVTTTMPSDSDTQEVVFTPTNNGQVVSLTFKDGLGSNKTITFKNDAQSSTQGPANLNIVAPSGTILEFNNPFTHVVINGTSYENISGTFSANSLIINKDVHVHKIDMTAGGLEIHGTVDMFVPHEDHGTIIVRECEGLSGTVYVALKEFIDPRYCAVENATLPTTYDIVLNAVAEVNGMIYPTLAEAVAAANTGDIVKLVKNIDLTEQVEISGKEISLDLNGKTIEYKGTATLKSGALLVHNGAGLTIEGEGSIKSGTSAYAAIALTKIGDSDESPAKLTVNGGNIEGFYYGIVGNGNRHNTQIVINGGTITSTDSEATAIYHPQNGTLTINGGTIKGENGLYIKSGTVANISGATIEATGAKGEYEYAGDGFEHTGDAIIVDNCNYPGGRPTVTIRDATLISAHGFQVGAYFSAPETGISDIYSTVHTDLTVPEGYEWNEDGKLVKGAVVVKNQDEFVAACAAAVSGDVLTLGSGEFAIGPVDIDGKTLTFKGQGAANTKIFIGNGGYDGNGGHGSNKTANMTFEDVTLDDLASDSGYLTGFTEAAGLTFRNVTFNVGFSNWGNKGGNVSFYNCTFNQNTDGKYNVQELRSASNTHYLFDGCTFNSTPGRFINAYKQGGSTSFIEIIVKNCSFTGTNQSKAAVNLKSGYSDGCNIELYLLGNNTTTNVAAGSKTGNPLFDDNDTHATVHQGTDKDSASIIWQNGAKEE